jgi:hypothetical protein
MEELIKNIILNSDTETGFIGDAIEIGNVVLELLEDGVKFNVDVEELDEMIDNNDILQLTKIVCGDCGEISYIVEGIFDEDGNTIPDELETLYIDSDLIDCVELEAFGDTEIIVVEVYYEDEESECDGCCEDCEFEDEETMGSALTNDFLDSLEEIDIDDGEAVYNLLVSYFDSAYQSGLDDSKAEIVEAIEAINSLR